MRQHLCQFILAIILIVGALRRGREEDSVQVVAVPTSATKADYYPWVTFPFGGANRLVCEGRKRRGSGARISS
jgi:hypothetical protein